MLHNLSYLSQNAINIVILPFSMQVVHFWLTHAQKFRYQPSHLNVKQLQRNIEASYMCASIAVPDLWCNTMMKNSILDVLYQFITITLAGKLFSWVPHYG
jgi:dimeric dUTPase (all-alpha-NTP-PPase superfamily)